MKDARSQGSAAKVVRLCTQAEIARDREDAARDAPLLAKHGTTSEEIRETLMHPPKGRKRKRAAAIEMPRSFFMVRLRSSSRRRSDECAAHPERTDSR
jgi:hypothetical protein